MAIIKFQTNIPQTLRFPFGNAREYPSKYNPQEMQYQYKVVPQPEQQGAELDVIYATAGLHQQLVAAGVQQGNQIYTITKQERSWIVVPADGSAAQPVPVQAPTPPAAPQQSTALPTAWQATGTASPYELSAAYGWCLQEAIRLWAQSGISAQTSDLHASASTLFIQLCRSGAFRELASRLGAQAEASVPPAPPQEAPPLPTVAGGSDEDELPF